MLSHRICISLWDFEFASSAFSFRCSWSCWYSWSIGEEGCDWTDAVFFISLTSTFKAICFMLMTWLALIESRTPCCCLEGLGWLLGRKFRTLQFSASLKTLATPPIISEVVWVFKRSLYRKYYLDVNPILPCLLLHFFLALLDSGLHRKLWLLWALPRLLFGEAPKKVEYFLLVCFLLSLNYSVGLLLTASNTDCLRMGDLLWRLPVPLLCDLYGLSPLNGSVGACLSS